MKYALVYVDPFGLQAYAKGGKNAGPVPTVVEGPYCEAEFVTEAQYNEALKRHTVLRTQAFDRWGEEDLVLAILRMEV